MSARRLLADLYGDVWCTTCRYVHIPGMPQVTFQCVDCGFGQWEPDMAERHATDYPKHVVHAVHHQTVRSPGALADWIAELVSDVVVDHPMWIDEREGHIAAFVGDVRQRVLALVGVDPDGPPMPGSLAAMIRADMRVAILAEMATDRAIIHGDGTGP